jgi:hypothetical protein
MLKFSHAVISTRVELDNVFTGVYLTGEHSKLDRLQFDLNRTDLMEYLAARYACFDQSVDGAQTFAYTAQALNYFRAFFTRHKMHLLDAAYFLEA